MPILLQLNYADGSSEQQYIPAEIWRRSPKAVNKLIVTAKDKVLQEVIVDPKWETADVDIENNFYPRRIVPSRIEAYKAEKSKAKVSRDIMQDSKTELKDPAKKSETDNSAEQGGN